MAENKQQQEIKEITEKLEQGVKELFESEKYKVFLHTMSKFHNYSLNNTMLIAMQKPDATLVAGYTAWQHDHERHVMKGEKGIRIFAPAPYKVKVEQDKIDPVTNKPVLDEHNNPVKEVVEIKKPAFKLVSVFDVSQTEGKDIPSLGVDELLGDVEDYVHFFDALERSCPVPIGFEQIEGGAKGYYHQTECRIAINEGMSEVQNVKTLIHEMAHQKLHAVENIDKDLKLSRSAKEVEAESIAYVICQHYGIDTAEYSFAYLAGWSADKDTPELKASLDRIRKASNEMINEIDGHIAEINLELQSEQSDHITCYLKISNSMGSEYAVDRIAGTPEQIEAALREVQEAGKTDTPIENIEAFLESKGIPVLALGSSMDDEPIRLVHPEYEYDVDTNEIYRDGAALGREMTREERALRLAVTMDTLAYESDLYDYRDRVEDREEFVLGLQKDLLGDKETVFGMVEWFQELVDEETNEAENAQKIIDELCAFMDDFDVEDRFVVTETSDAFMPGEDFAIMDNQTGEYVYDEDGAVITFPTKDEADRYLAGMNEADKEKAEIVGVVSYASGEYFEYTDKEAYLRCIQNEIEFASTTGFRYETRSNDPELRKAVDDEVYNLFGEDNPHSLEFYQGKEEAKAEEQPTGRITFYVAECMEFSESGELHEGLTLKEAFEIYEKIPSDRMHGIKGIGFELEDGSIYDGKFELMHGGIVADEQINYITHYRNSPLVQQAIEECRQELKARGIEKMDEIEAGAYKVGEDKYLSIQVATDGSWDYSIYDEHFQLVDGGQIGDASMSFAQARNSILESEGMMQKNLRSLNPDVLSEQVDKVQGVQMLPDYQKEFVFDKMDSGYDVTCVFVNGGKMSLVDHAMTQEEMTKIDRQMSYSDIPKMLYSSDQWKEIESGMKHELDVRVFAKPEYTASQMKEIRIGLDKGIDVSAFASPEFSDKQMREIRRGIEAGIDVSSYAQPDISAGDMRKAFFALKDGTNALENQSQKAEPDKDSGMYRYYSTQRPVTPGTFPGKPTTIHNFDSRESVCGGQMQAWGYVEYEKPLTEKQMKDYELKPAVREAVAKEQPSFSMPEKQVEKDTGKKKSVMENLRRKQAQIAKADVKQTKSHEKGARE